MSEQALQAKGGDDWNIIKGQLRDMHTQNVFNFEVRIRDGLAIIGAEDKNFLKKMVRYEQKRGNNNISYVPIRKIVIEKFPGELKDTITKDILTKLKGAGANVTKS